MRLIDHHPFEDFNHETDFLQKLADVVKQRTLEANGAGQLNFPWTFDSPEEVKKAGITNVDAVEVVDYYKTPRGFHSSANNKRLFISDKLIIAFDAFHLAEHLLTQSLFIVVGDRFGAFGAYRDGFDRLRKTASTNKKIHVVSGASHYDLYVQPKATAEALDKLIPFFQENL